MLGVVYELTPEPLANTEPPLEAAYQSIVSPAPGVAEIDTVPVPQREDDPAVGADGIAFTVTFITLFELIAVGHDQPTKVILVIVMVVEPVLLNADVLKVPVPALKLMVAVDAVAVFAPDKLYVTV